MAIVPMSEEKREIILKAATRAFAEKGFAAVGIREIAREAGLNSATLYHYFENKEGIYADGPRADLRPAGGDTPRDIA